MTQQEKYWEILKQFKFETIYLDDFIHETHSLDNGINIFTAIVSSTSIAGWAIWQKFQIIWSLAIAIMQVISATKQYLPYAKRLKILQQMYNEIYKLYLEVEYTWHDVANGKYTESELNKNIYEYKKKRSDISERHLTSHVLPNRSKLIDKATITLDRYLQKNFIGGGQ